MGKAKPLIMVFGGEAESIDADSFVEMVSAHFDILSSISRRLSPESPRKWRITKLSMKSPVQIGAVPDTGDFLGEPPEYQIYLGAMADLQAGKATQALFPEKLIGNAEKFAKALANGVDFVEYRIGDRKMLTLKKGMGDKIREAKAVITTAKFRGKVVFARAHDEWTSIIGSLDRVDLHGATKELRIYDELTDAPVKCIFSEEIWPTIHRHIGKRVAAYGRGTYSVTGEIQSIHLDSLEPLPLSSRLPKKYKKIDLTGGEGSDKFIGGLRDE